MPSKKRSKGKNKSSRKRSSGGRKKSSRGKVIKACYSRKSKSGKKTSIKATGIDKQGQSGVKCSPKIIVITDTGVLGNFGYQVKIKKDIRHKALDKAVKKYGELKVLKRLNAIRTLNKSHLITWKKLDVDVKYIQKKYFPERRTVEHSKAKPY